MSLQWTFAATLLFTEIAAVIILSLPFISPTRWQKIFRSKILKLVSDRANIYFNIFIAILALLFFDSIREMRKYSTPLVEDADLKHHPEAETMLHMKLFRSQRNFYIAGFALFLFFVLRRLVTLISTQAHLIAESEASKKQAESATVMAKKLLEDKENKINTKKETQDDNGAEVEDLNKKLAQAKSELRHANLDMESMKKQSESTKREYDRMLMEHASLQKKLDSFEDSGTKKDN